jgi:hypothetical protein
MKNYIYLDGKKIELSEETAKRLRGEIPERIPCPIRMAYIPCIDDMAIPFGKQVLYFDHHSETFGVRALMGLDLIPCDLISCKREDLNPGDTAYRYEDESPDFDDLAGYCKVLDGREYVYSGGISSKVKANGVFPGADEWDYWWKVVPR